MKTTFATTFSIVGVLVAGGIAFAVNTSVLDAASNQFSASQALVAEAAGIVPTANAPIVDSTAITVTSPAIVETAYNIAGVAVVTLSQNGASLSVVNVAPASDYTYSSNNQTESRVEVTFNSGVKTMKFRAEIIGDRIITSVLNETAPPATAPLPRTHDEDDENENEDRENNDHEGEDDDD
jgi:hypothetical protein